MPAVLDWSRSCILTRSLGDCLLKLEETHPEVHKPAQRGTELLFLILHRFTFWKDWIACCFSRISTFFLICNVKIVFIFLGRNLWGLMRDYSVPYEKKEIKVLLFYVRRIKYALERKDSNCMGNTWLSDKIHFILTQKTKEVKIMNLASFYSGRETKCPSCQSFSVILLFL